MQAKFYNVGPPELSDVISWFINTINYREWWRRSGPGEGEKEEEEDGEEEE